MADDLRKSLKLDELDRVIGGLPIGSLTSENLQAALTLKQLHVQIAAIEAQEAAAAAQREAGQIARETMEVQRLAAAAEAKAAEAAVATAKATEQNAKYMFWSVLAAAGSAVITAGGVAFNVFSNYHP
jgi:hypothetical protein